jgi:catechol 2,3-dioxygenase-like lactoylglutathione lyase family enzyme
VTEQSAATSAPAAPTIPFEYDEALVIAIGVSDLDRSIEWYRHMLGFELTYKLDEYGWGEVRSQLAGVSIGLGQSEEPQVTGAVPTWSVKDIEAARHYLESHGVRFDGDTQQVGDMVKLATFYDPDGNPWMLAQRVDTGYREQ